MFFQKGKEKAGENELLQGIIEELKELAEHRNALIFSKETTHAHRAMNQSLFPTGSR